VTAQHPLKSGTLTLWIDGAIRLAAPLSGRVTRKVLFVSIRKGSLERSLGVAPGVHRIRVEVRWDDNVRTDRIWGTFRSGRVQHLQISVGTVFKDLSLGWR
jgi:hypothetical protein